MFRCSLLLVPTILAVSTQVATADQSGHWIVMDGFADFSGTLGQANVWDASVAGVYEQGQSGPWSYGGADGIASQTIDNHYSRNKVNVQNMPTGGDQGTNWITYFNSYYDTNGTTGQQPQFFESTYEMYGSWNVGNNSDYDLNWGINKTDFSDFNLSDGGLAYVTVNLYLYNDANEQLFHRSGRINSNYDTEIDSDGAIPWKDAGIRHDQFVNAGHTEGRLTIEIEINGGTQFMPNWSQGEALNRAEVWVGIGETVMEIPAPGSLALLGLGGLFARRRRRQA